MRELDCCYEGGPLVYTRAPPSPVVAHTRRRRRVLPGLGAAKTQQRRAPKMDTNPNARDMNRLKRVQVSHRFPLPKTPRLQLRMGSGGSELPLLPAVQVSLFLPAYMSAYSPVVLHDAVHTTCDKPISPIPSAHSRHSPPPLGCLATTASANSPLNCCSRVQAPVGNPHARNQWLYLNPPQPHSHKTSVVKACHSTKMSREPLVSDCPSIPSYD